MNVMLARAEIDISFSKLLGFEILAIFWGFGFKRFNIRDFFVLENLVSKKSLGFKKFGQVKKESKQQERENYAK